MTSYQLWWLFFPLLQKQLGTYVTVIFVGIIWTIIIIAIKLTKNSRPSARRTISGTLCALCNVNRCCHFLGVLIICSSVANKTTQKSARTQNANRRWWFAHTCAHKIYGVEKLWSAEANKILWSNHAHIPNTIYYVIVVLIVDSTVPSPSTRVTHYE